MFILHKCTTFHILYLFYIYFIYTVNLKETSSYQLAMHKFNKLITNKEYQ